MRPLNLLFIALISTGCADLYLGRSYLSEMEHDDTPFFEAGNDFPVLAGDTGRYWRDDKELRARTPASEEDLLYRRGETSLKEELRALENAQPEHALAQYQKYRHRFGNISEKIYFLKLSYQEREEYLEQRGFIESQPIMTAHERMGLSRRSDILLGMSKDDVRHNFGKPLRVEIAGNPSYENERWLYQHNGASKYIYFESGRVEGWE